MDELEIDLLSNDTDDILALLSKRNYIKYTEEEENSYNWE
jgi:hypothetical protein